MSKRPADDHPDTWHLCENEQRWNWGINCPDCYKGRGFELQEAPLVGTVPGGHNDSRGDARYDFQKNFDKGLNGYKKARDEGLQPQQTTVEAVAAAKEQVKSQERAIKKLKLGKDETSQLKLAKGVNA